MRLVLASLTVACVLTPAPAQEIKDGPANEKAQKTYKDALKELHEKRAEAALEKFKKADKQDDGHCLACQKQMIKYGSDYGDWKAAELGAEEIVGEAKSDRDRAVAHFQLASVLMEEGLKKHQQELFGRTRDEIAKALAAYANFPDALYLDGRALANLRQDEAAKARFEEYLKTEAGDDADRRRARRYITRPELARARMAPPFELTTADGRRFAVNDLQGKVVLLDFWAMWCPPCLRALPHIREIAKKFQGQPLVILSVSLDGDEQKWKEFIVKNDMTWPQYRAGGFKGALPRLFGVSAIPHTFTIDADGVLQDEHIGDASIEGNLEKLIARAREMQPAQTPGK